MRECNIKWERNIESGGERGKEREREGEGEKGGEREIERNKGGCGGGGGLREIEREEYGENTKRVSGVYREGKWGHNE
jgi:hypothetical protein